MDGPLDPSQFMTQAQVNDKEHNLAAIDPRIRRALELLQETLTAQVGDLASGLNLSDSRFRHLFKKELGISPMQYVRSIQLERARGLLENSFLTVKEIAASVGVNDISHFVRNYKLLYGQTPSQTRGLSRKSPGGIPRKAAMASK